MSFVTKTEHALAIAAQDAVKAEKVAAIVASSAADLLRKAQVAEPVIEQVSAALITAATGNAGLGITAVNVERTIFALAAPLLQLSLDTSDAAKAQFKNIVSDEQLASDARAVAAAVMSKAKSSGLVQQK